MTGNRCLLIAALLLVITIVVAEPPHGFARTANQSYIGAPGPSREAADVKGTWSGTFHSRHAGVASFTITVVIDVDSGARLIGKSSLSSDCFRDVDLKVTVNGSKISLAGSDQDGANITFQGTLDQTGAVLKLRYIINGSASGKCESDDGTGTMAKR